MAERPVSRLAITPARRAQIAALAVACCGALAIWMFQLWLTSSPIVDLRL